MFSESMSQKINQAKEILLNPIKRKIYDLELNKSFTKVRTEHQKTNYSNKEFKYRSLISFVFLVTGMIIDNCSYKNHKQEK